MRLGMRWGNTSCYATNTACLWCRSKQPPPTINAAHSSATHAAALCTSDSLPLRCDATSLRTCVTPLSAIASSSLRYLVSCLPRRSSPPLQATGGFKVHSCWQSSSKFV